MSSNNSKRTPSAYEQFVREKSPAKKKIDLALFPTKEVRAINKVKKRKKKPTI